MNDCCKEARKEAFLRAAEIAKEYTCKADYMRGDNCECDVGIAQAIRAEAGK